MVVGAERVDYFGIFRNSVERGSTTGVRPARDTLTGAELDELTRALANTTRRQVLRSCWSTQRSAGELAAETELAPASVSEHLKVLRKTGLVVLERAGNHRLYRADTDRVAAVLRALGDDLGPPDGAG